MKASARDIRYGRRGGRWTDHIPIDTTTAPRCTICVDPMLLGQTVAHAVCAGLDVAFPTTTRKRTVNVQPERELRAGDVVEVVSPCQHDGVRLMVVTIDGPAPTEASLAKAGLFVIIREDQP